MKKKDSISKLARLTGFILLSVGMIVLLSSCENSDEPDPDPIVPIERGTDSYDIADATPQDYLEGLVAATSNGEIFAAYGLVPNGQWFLDVPHSAVNWKTLYNGEGSDLTGKFSWFALKNFSFDETDPSKISFTAKVMLNSVVTGQILRDDGCLLVTYGTDAAFIDEPANLAVIKSTSASYNVDDAGYTVLADLTFLGVTKGVTMNLEYLGKTEYDSYTLISFEAEFQFNAKSDFFLEDASVAELASVTLDLNLKKNK